MTAEWGFEQIQKYLIGDLRHISLYANGDLE
jgi:hypothetical protein